MLFKIMRNLAAGFCTIGIASCGLLDVSDPTVIEDADVATATGADFLRRDAVRRLYVATHERVMSTGHLSDELFGYSPYALMDQRDAGMFGAIEYSLLQEVRRATTIAIPQLRKYGGLAVKGPFMAEMFAVRGYAAISLAESFCAGFPLHDVVDFEPVYGTPLTTDEVFTRAVADFDSALTHAADSARILALTSIGRGRALLGLGRFSEAGAAVRDVPTGYVWNAEFTSNIFPQRNFLGFLWQINSSPSVSDREGQNGLDFVGANDPRLPLRPTSSLDGIQLYAANKYPNDAAPIVIASGVEARLIEAETALRAGDSRWLSILNELRASQTTPAMPSLSDPGTEGARVDLLFRERAFWLFGTAHRLGDLRRLIRLYGRRAEAVFPIGQYYAGGEYGTATSIPFPAELEALYSPGVTGCMD
jgi:hypothetical protein